MSITIKTHEDIDKLREAGKRLAHVVATVATEVKAGVNAATLDEMAERMIREGGDTPSFLGYASKGETPYPSTLCVSCNDEIVHGVPYAETVFKEGDIVSIDCGLIHDGVYVDHALTVAVGEIDPEDSKLINITRESMMVGIKAAQAGNTTGDVGHAIESFVDGRYGIIRVLAGHGVGYAVHEEPYVPNYGTAGKGTELKPGMVIAIEPMLTRGSEDIITKEDGFTYTTEDGSQSAHFEHTVLITENGPEILTKV